MKKKRLLTIIVIMLTLTPSFIFSLEEWKTEKFKKKFFKILSIILYNPNIVIKDVHDPFIFTLIHEYQKRQ